MLTLQGLRLHILNFKIPLPMFFRMGLAWGGGALQWGKHGRWGEKPFQQHWWWWKPWKGWQYDSSSGLIRHWDPWRQLISSHGKSLGGNWSWAFSNVFYFASPAHNHNQYLHLILSVRNTCSGFCFPIWILTFSNRVSVYWLFKQIQKRIENNY